MCQLARYVLRYLPGNDFDVLEISISPDREVDSLIRSHRLQDLVELSGIRDTASIEFGQDVTSAKLR